MTLETMNKFKTYYFHITAFIALIIIICFFLPWFVVFNVITFNGVYLPEYIIELVELYNSTNEETTFLTAKWHYYFLYSIYLIPMSALYLFINSIFGYTKTPHLIVCAIIPYVLTVVFPYIIGFSYTYLLHISAYGYIITLIFSVILLGFVVIDNISNVEKRKLI